MLLSIILAPFDYRSSVIFHMMPLYIFQDESYFVILPVHLSSISADWFQNLLKSV